MGKLSGKVAVLTASTNGIGFAIAKKLASQGAKVVVSSRKEANVKSAVENLKQQGFTDIMGIVCHVANSEERTNLLKKSVEAFGRMDILIFNAAVNPVLGMLTENVPESAFDKIFEVNVKAAFLLTKEALPYFRDGKGGNILYMSSITGMQPFQLLGCYSVSKTTLFSLTKVFAHELAPSNIRVNCIAPGLIETNFAKSLLADETLQNAAMSLIPLNRFGQPDDISGIVAFLCSDDAAYITGETIFVTGGMPSRL